MNAGSNFKTTVSGRLLRWLGIATAAALVSATAMAQITGTKHNLSSTGPGNKFSGTDQICVFCHTPHGADNTAPVPLWNRNIGTPPTYTTYDSLGTPTLTGKVLTVGSISLACLSCHDGTQAMNSVINAPGSGFAGSAAWQAGSWGATSSTPTGAALLGTDLSNDHPIGIEYCGGGINGNGTTGFTTSTCTDSDFIGTTATTTSDGRTAQVKTAQIGGAQAFWVDLNSNATRDKGDIALYNRNFSSKGGAAVGPSVECGSCHEPHTAATGIGNVAFMRVTAAGSQICLSCHVK